MKQSAAKDCDSNIMSSWGRNMRGKHGGSATSTLFTYVININSIGRGTSVFKQDIPTYYESTGGQTRRRMEGLASLSCRWQCTS
jgi:hypothetical protein